MPRLVEPDAQWQEFRPRPARVSPGAALLSVFWNPRGNESLYLTSCAERLLNDPSRERATELWARVAGVVRAEEHGGRFLRVRLVEVSREGGRVVRHVVFESEAYRLDVLDGRDRAPSR